MSFQSLQERLAALQETTSQLKELIDRLADLKFQPGSVPLDASEEGSVSGELSTEIGNLLRDGDDERELLLEEVEYLRHEDKARLRDGVERQGQELDRCRSNFRRARLAAKKSLSQAQRLERELMIQSYTQPPVEPSTTSTAEPQPVPAAQLRQKARQQYETSSLSEKDRQNVTASSRVTTSLRQMHDAAAAELERSEYAKQTMEQSSLAFTQLGESYSSLETTLKSSRSLLGTLLKSQKSDTWYLKTSFYMLVTVLAWLVFRRLVYGPVWWLVWFPLRTIFGVGKGVGHLATRGGSDVDSGRVEVGGNEKVPVEGLPKKDLPTAKVGEETQPSADDPDAMIEKIGEVLDDGTVPDEGLEPEVKIGQDEEVDSRLRDEL